MTQTAAYFREIGKELCETYKERQIMMNRFYEMEKEKADITKADKLLEELDRRKVLRKMSDLERIKLRQDITYFLEMGEFRRHKPGPQRAEAVIKEVSDKYWAWRAYDLKNGTKTAPAYLAHMATVHKCLVSTVRQWVYRGRGEMAGQITPEEIKALQERAINDPAILERGPE